MRQCWRGVRPRTAEVLAKQAACPLVRGIRSKPVTSLSPDSMTPGAPGTMRSRTLCSTGK